MSGTIPTDASGHALDICPMCTGSGKHNLKAPNGMSVVILSSENEEATHFIFAESDMAFSETWTEEVKVLYEWMKTHGVLRVKKKKKSSRDRWGDESPAFEESNELTVNQVMQSLVSMHIELGYDLQSSTISNAGRDQTFVMKWRWI